MTIIYFNHGEPITVVETGGEVKHELDNNDRLGFYANKIIDFNHPIKPDNTSAIFVSWDAVKYIENKIS